MCPQITCTGRCIVTLVAFMWLNGIVSIFHICILQTKHQIHYFQEFAPSPLCFVFCPNCCFKLSKIYYWLLVSNNHKCQFSWHTFTFLIRKHLPRSVRWLVRQSVTFSDFHCIGVYEPSQSVPRDLWPFRHFIRESRNEKMEILSKNLETTKLLILFCLNCINIHGLFTYHVKHHVKDGCSNVVL